MLNWDPIDVRRRVCNLDLTEVVLPTPLMTFLDQWIF